MHNIVITIVIVVIVFQLFFFVKNILRMIQFKNIFSENNTWRPRQDPNTELINGIYGGDKNPIFKSIHSSINEYLENCAGSVIDFGLLKDAVDRHCDSVENDIATQTPVPLYLGLVGTMAGVIFGLWDLLQSNAIRTLMGSGAGTIDKNAVLAAQGIDNLLSGVALAMGASICGILFTTINSVFFKHCKLKEESGKNSFLVWMQAKLLPELPTDISDALKNLVKNLNSFNKTFSINTEKLGNALKDVNKVYVDTAEVIKYIRDMDVMKMATANVRVLGELKDCTDKLEVFNQYLSDINGYTATIHNFESMFRKETNRLAVLEEIRDFFRNYKGSVSKITGKADDTLQSALQSIKDSTAENVAELHKIFIKQSEEFKKILNAEKEEYEGFMKDMNVQFKTQVSTLPEISKQLKDIPNQIEKLIGKVEDSNTKLLQNLKSAKGKEYDNGSTPAQISIMPKWMKWLGLTSGLVIIITCIFNIVIYFFPIKDLIQNKEVNKTQTKTSTISKTKNLSNLSIIDFDMKQNEHNNKNNRGRL